MEKVSTSRPGRFNSGEKVPSIYHKGVSVEYRFELEAVQERERDISSIRAGNGTFPTYNLVSMLSKL
jgi:hypothetical protein